jgi:hypothetical protein
VFLEISFVILDESLSFTHYLLVDAGKIVLLHSKVNYLNSGACRRATLWKSQDCCVSTATSLLLLLMMSYFILLPRFPILTRSSLLIHTNLPWTISRDSLVVLKSIFIVWCPLCYLTTRYEVVDLDNLCGWAARCLVNDLIVGWSRTEAWFLLMKRNALASTWAWSNLLTHSRSQGLVSGWWCRWDINRSALSSPRLARSPTARIAILTVCSDITGNRPPTQLLNHLFSIQLSNFLNKLVHHRFVLHYFSNIYDLALFEVVEDKS